MPTATDAAKWMLDEVHKTGMLYQDTAVDDIERLFGTAFVYENDSGNPAIGRDVLKAFRKLSGDAVIWEASEKAWRPREAHDDPGRRQY